MADKTESYGVFEVAPPNYLNDWQMNDVDLDALFNVHDELDRLRKASKLGLLDYYVDKAHILKTSFKQFLLDLAARKFRSEIPFELVPEPVVTEAFVAEEIQDCLRYTPWIEDTEEAIEEAFKVLVASNPPRN